MPRLGARLVRLNLLLSSLKTISCLLQAMVRAMPKRMWETADQAIHNAVVGGRKGNTDKYKPGVKAIMLVGEGVWARV